MTPPAVQAKDNVYLFYPNLLGYGRIVFGVISCAFMLHNPWIASVTYFLSAFLDAFDGHLASSTRFGAMLDQLTDRLMFMALLMALGHLYPRGLFFFQMVAIIDIASHWLHLHAGDLLHRTTHKSSDNPILHYYYTSRPFLFFMCFGNEAFFGLLYINAWWEDRSTMASILMPLLLLAAGVIAVAKTAISLVHLVEAAQEVVLYDTRERLKND
ncbi:CDP-diacylglycerol--inositol 3-phosphatidyltransferase [Aphelenchoides fujianensis]|nr:CDP-diacylglycerol--inositol 3-phosphatidyltransferase [Aphelenchoides fujianensis]